jgi:putative intracellular protease/amidase
MCPFYRRQVGSLHDGDTLQGEYDAIIIPGGLKGAETISQSSHVQSLVKTFYEKRKLIGMICAGKGNPIVEMRNLSSQP